HAGAWIQIYDEAIGQRLTSMRLQLREADDSVFRCGAAHRPLRNVHLEGSKIGQPYHRRLVVSDDVVNDPVAGVALDPAHPVRGTHWRVLFIERDAVWADAVGEPQSGHRPVADVRQHDGGNAQVVINYLSLTEADAWIQNFVEICQGQGSAANACHKVRCGGPIPIPSSGIAPLPAALPS